MGRRSTRSGVMSSITRESNTRWPRLTNTPGRRRPPWRLSIRPRSAKRWPWSRISWSTAIADVAVITLTTDFGTRDPYVAEMKGGILSITRDVHVVDIPHGVAPHVSATPHEAPPPDALESALTRKAAAPRFPAATIHVAVVDPGVGTARRAL